MPVTYEELAESVVSSAAGGYSFETWNGRIEAGQLVSSGFVGAVGGINNINFARFQVDVRDEAELRHWVDAGARVLVILADAWQADFGSVWTADVRDAQQVTRGQPWTGWVTWLSAGRRARVPEDLASTATVMPDGSLVMSMLPRDGTVPSMHLIVHLAERLREAGAFEPCPVDRSRW
ncbi:hypothetical protein [Nocardia colli]|uniref:hypothetical protein n=1 Tax=Nocardia colli TaxID=2545717 RepID=UPI0035DCC881